MTEFARLRPHQLQDGIAAKTPVVLPIGVMEYHGQHLPAGVNLLAVTEVLERLGDAIITLPPLPMGRRPMPSQAPKAQAPCILMPT